jgi:hypothetical protein
MAQQPISDYPIDPVVTSGTQLADILNRTNQVMNSGNSGTSRPPTVTAGGLWVKTGGPVPELYLFDGTTDIFYSSVGPQGIQGPAGPSDWNAIPNIPPIVYPDGGTYNINITGKSEYAERVHNNAGTMRFNWSDDSTPVAYLWGSDESSNARLINMYTLANSHSHPSSANSATVLSSGDVADIQMGMPGDASPGTIVTQTSALGPGFSTCQVTGHGTFDLGSDAAQYKLMINLFNASTGQWVKSDYVISYGKKNGGLDRVPFALTTSIPVDPNHVYYAVISGAKDAPTGIATGMFHCSVRLTMLK